MLKIKVWCLPHLTQRQLQALYGSIVRAAKAVPEAGAESHCVLFPADLMEQDLGKEIIVEVSGLRPLRPRKIPREIREQLAVRIGHAVQEHLPLAEIDVRVEVDRYDEGRWSYTPPVQEAVDPELLKKSIDALNLSVRDANTLRAENIQTLGDVRERGRRGLREIPSIGSRKVEQIAIQMVALGVPLPN